MICIPYIPAALQYILETVQVISSSVTGSRSSVPIRSGKVIASA